MAEIQKALKIYKNEGETPLEAILKFKKQNPKYKDLPMTYAGRLDPMAEGLLLVLVGEECKKKEEYLGLDKEYEVEVLFGVETDTYDILGKISKVSKVHKVFKVESGEIKNEIRNFVGKFTQEYPAFSSKTVDGEPVFALAKTGRLPKEMPTKEVEIYDIKVGEMRKISSYKLLVDIEKRISRVNGDFRQKTIISKWRKILEKEKSYFQILPIKVKCSSGTYMRSLAYNLGKKLNTSALAYKIKRTKVEKFNLRKVT